MKEILTPVEWAALLGQRVFHWNLFKECTLIGVRIKSYENNNLMLLIENSDNGHFWVYDYELTKINENENKEEIIIT